MRRRLAGIVVLFGAMGGCAPLHPRPPERVTGGVRFEVLAPKAKSAAVAGDFNHWEPRRGTLHPDPQAPGLWSGTLSVPPGVHRYMILLDGRRWVTPPGVERTVPDGFGGVDGIVTVEGEP